MVWSDVLSLYQLSFNVCLLKLDFHHCPRLGKGEIRTNKNVEPIIFCMCMSQVRSIQFSGFLFNIIINGMPHRGVSLENTCRNITYVTYKYFRWSNSFFDSKFQKVAGISFLNFITRLVIVDPNCKDMHTSTIWLCYSSSYLEVWNKTNT